MTEIHKLLTGMGACEAAVVWADKWAASGSHKTAWEACERSDWMLWLLERTTVSQDDPRLRLMACDFAEAVLYLVPAGEDRPRKAIDAARAFCAGTITCEEMDAASNAAYAAYAASVASAAYTAWNVAYAASVASAAYTAWNVAYAAYAASVASAAMNAARADQAKIIRRYFPQCPPLQDMSIH